VDDERNEGFVREPAVVKRSYSMQAILPSDPPEMIAAQSAGCGASEVTRAD
jgi:hypothetical protein